MSSDLLSKFIMKIFKESYVVKLNYQKPDGYWVVGHIEEVFVDVEHGVNEKNNHAKAEKMALKKFENAKIVSVSYC